MNLQIGSVSWEVRETDAMEDYGRTDLFQAVIWLNENQSQDLMLDSLFHEVLHSLVFTFGIDMGTPEKEESIIKSLTPALLLLFKSNPELVNKLLAG